MTSVVNIWNMALSHIGADASVVSSNPPDATVEAARCAQFYPIARAELLVDGAFAFTKTRVLLAEEATNPSTVWTYAYTLPSDCLRAMRVLQVATLQPASILTPRLPATTTADELALFTERGTANFEIEDGVLLTHEPEAVLLYLRDITDTTRFSPKLVVALSYLLASYIAGPIIKGADGAQAAASLRKAAKNLAGEAKALDARASSEQYEHVPAHMRARQ